MMRRILLTALCIFCLYADGNSQLPSCLNTFGCSTDRYSVSCDVYMQYRTCADTQSAKRIVCTNSSSNCTANCSCGCSLTGATTGYRGVVSWTDTCVETEVVRTYECNNCGNPMPTPTPGNGCTTASFAGGCPVGTEPNGYGMCCMNSGGCEGWSVCYEPEVYDYNTCSCVYPSPIIIDVAGDGFNLSGANSGVAFDINVDGRAERVAWTVANSDDSWLALDRDGNGTVDNGAELFGNFTPQPPSDERNGFRALAPYDEPRYGGNGDRMISAADSVYSLLRLWRDANHNGVSERNELHTLPSLDVTALGLDYHESQRTDEYGNRFKYRAKVRDAKGARVNRWAWDVFLVAAR